MEGERSGSASTPSANKTSNHASTDKRRSTDCHYSAPSKVGKPKGSRNKKTIEKLKVAEKDAANNQTAGSDSQGNEIYASVIDDSNTLGQVSTYTSSPFYCQSINMDSTFGILDRDIDPIFVSSGTEFMDETHARNNWSDCFSNMKSLISVEADPMSMAMDETTNADGYSNDFQPQESSEGLEIRDFVTAANDRNALMPTSIVPESRRSERGHSLHATQYETRSLEQLPPCSASQTSVQSRVYRDRIISTEQCRCLQVQVQQLCELRQVEQRQSSILFDTIQHFTAGGYQLLERTFRCPVCLPDQQCLQIASMVLQTFSKWVENFQVKSLQPSPHRPILNIQLGSYNTNPEEGLLLEVVLISRFLVKTRGIVRLFRERIQQLKDFTNGNEVVVEYLQQVATSYLHVVEVKRKDIKDKYVSGGHEEGFGMKIDILELSTEEL
ncbi:hypothetical protein GLAREA_03735 [Glarea lozoyensis ATCC 20868]|uniref:Uncharacterized protein n=1 Tax=Glarea lozoyensis (strain ATCC 20868 / MF5171) TaxID=1116229 RepID=S3DWL4_GLAL2|nr:uncharacterized protein GLAREA_03735 [Glarea lozoyensis ATCC 20868]EPE30768.1 hypothetical protein GLAREA_03735 [Glarea lozoyensis ATCC 20868]